MTAISAPMPRHSSAPFLYFLLGLIFVAIVMVSAHAMLTHGSAASKAAQCFNGQGTIQKQIFVCPLNGRTFEICKGFDGVWYVMINGCDGKNITCFPRSAAKCFSDVAAYAKKTGFTFPYP